MTYECHNPRSRIKSERIWTGELSIRRFDKWQCEMEVTGRGSRFYIIFGKYQNGGYLCIPEWHVGCELADFKDLFWNTERLEKQIGKADAITVAMAIKVAAGLINEIVV